MSWLTDLIKDRYTTVSSGVGPTQPRLDLGNIVTDLGVAGALYGIINPNDSSGLASFFGTGGRQQPVGYTGGIPNYMASRELAPNAFAQTYTTPTGELAPRRPGAAGRRYFTDTTFTQDTGTPFMGITAEQIAAQNQAAQDERDLFETLLGSVAAGTTGTTQEDYTEELATDASTQAAVNEALAGTGTATTGTTDTTTTDTAGDIPISGITGDGVANNTVTDENFGRIVDETGVFTPEGYELIPYNNFVNQFMGRELTAEDAAAIAASGYSLDTLATSFGVDPDALLNFVNFYVNSGGTSGTSGTGSTRELTEAELKQAVLDGTMSYSDALGRLNVADDPNPFGFTEEEQMALGIHESQRTGRGYKYNPTTGSMDLYDYDTDTFVDETGTTDAEETLTLNAADGSTSTIDLTGGADSLTTTGTADPNAGPLQATLDMVDASDGISQQEQDLIASILNTGGANIADVAEQFDVSQTDVIEGLLRGGYQTPAEIAATLNAVVPDTEFTEEALIANLLETGRTNPEEVAAYYGVPVEAVTARYRELGGTKFARGGNVNGYYLGGTTDGMADQIPATINNMQPAALSDGEFVIPADVVSHLGNGNSDAGAKQLYSMMERVRKDRTGNPKQGRQIDPNKYLA